MNITNIIDTIEDRCIHAILYGFIYFLIESVWKQHWTDWRMFVLSAVIGLLIGCINEFFTYDTDLRLQCIVGMMIALLCECIFGWQWNIVEGLILWDYSNLPFSFVCNQINLFFAIAWLFLSFVCILLDDFLVWKFHNTKVPYYKIGDKIIFKFPERK